MQIAVDSLTQQIREKLGLVEGFPYAAYVGAAWGVVEEMQRRGYDFELWGNSKGEWSCTFSRKDVDWRIPYAASDSSSAATAICTAALAALDAERSDGEIQ
jgi:hypothetical protein